MNKIIAALISTIFVIFVLSQSALAEDAAPATGPEPLHAIVNGMPITQAAFNGAYNNYLRQKYYHGQNVSEEQLKAARKEVGESLVERLLLLGEAARRGYVANEVKVAQAIAEYDTRYATSERWQKNREKMLPGLKQQLAEQDLLQQMEAIGRTIPETGDEEVRAFYKARIELFTEPEKMRMHTILLKVDPSAPKTTWDAARDEAARIVAQLRSGKNSFEDLASLHSQDPSAGRGGDMGYLHRGMIPKQVQAQLDGRPLGTIGDPIEVLEGIAIFRFDERIPSKVMAYPDVAARARALLNREQSKRAWETFIADLRKTATIQMVEHLPPAKPVAIN